MYELDPLTTPSYLVKERNGWLAVFNPDAKCQMDVQLRASYTQNGVVSCVKFSADGSLLAVGTDNAVVLYNLKEQTKLTFLLGAEEEGRKPNHARSVIISSDNKLLLAGAEDKYIRVWSIETGDFLRTLSGHTGEIYALAFTSDSRTLFSASGDRTVRVWDATQFSADVTEVPEITYRVLRPLSPEGKSSKLVFTSLSVDTTGSFVAAGSLDSMIRVWDVRPDSTKEEPVGVLHGHSEAVYGVQFLPGDMGCSFMYLVSASMDKSLKYWEILPDEKQFGCKKTLSGHSGAVLSASVLQVGREQRLASSSQDGTVRLWDLKTGIPYFMIQGHTNSVLSVDLSSDGSLLASGSGDREVRIWKCILQ